ncbi:MAG: pullulanase [Ignavibacteriales bacterium]|nr:pullulanase [Ignavibacteriales bacterium]
MAYFDYHIAGALEEKRRRGAHLDRYYSDKRLGAFFEEGATVFRIFAPRAAGARTHVFREPTDAPERAEVVLDMTRDADGVWEARLEGERAGAFYAFHLLRALDDADRRPALALDPYAKAVATYNDYTTKRLGVILPRDDYDWRGDEPLGYDRRDLIIYEAHLRDSTRHPSARATEPGTYRAFVEEGIDGGIDYLKDLGVNAVEFLPLQEFGAVEIPYKQPYEGRVNLWNPYERNHWGYMTAAFFAPSAYYSHPLEAPPRRRWIGADARAVREFKDVVRALHREGIAVIIDVVYNHVSEYDDMLFKRIDKDYYFRLGDEGRFLSESGCGNDFKSERPMARRLIVDSVLHWMRDYHVDGFRFDLGHLLDWETIETIRDRAREVNPNVVLIAEPWGGGYNPMGFSCRGWASWNDQIRNGVKGENPFDGRGWIFGERYAINDENSIKRYAKGTLARDMGLFHKPEHGVNYLESHDGYTLGDFIRLGLGDARKDEPIADVDEFVELTPEQLKLNKLAALFLLASRGIAMIAQGQEYARSKVIAESDAPDDRVGLLDENSYNKDNETNYVNYAHARVNAELRDYYRGLIALRKAFTAFRRAEYDDTVFGGAETNHLACSFYLEGDGEAFIVAMNADREREEPTRLPAGEWEIFVDPDKAGVEPLGRVEKELTVPPSSGYILRRVSGEPS